MSDPDRSDKKRVYEADTLNILSGRLNPAALSEDGEEDARPRKRRKDGSPISGDTVQRIIDRIKGI